MKKILTIFAAAVAALALASCNKDDSVYQENFSMGNEIAVEAMMAEDAQTRANANYATATNMKSFQLGIYNGKNEVANAAFNKPTASVKYWSDGNTYYWTPGDYTFFAVAQNTGAGTVAKDGFITKDGITFSDYTVDADEDLVVAYATGNQETPTTKLVFDHALARVRVVASFSKADSVKLQAKFIKWELRDVATTGTVIINGTTMTTDKVKWTPAETNVNVSDSADSTKFLDGKYRNVAGSAVADNQENTNKYWVNVIPNETVFAKKLIATVEFYNEDGTLVGTRYLTASTDANAVAKLTYADGFKYESGNAYTYKIDIVNNGGKDTDGDDPDDDLDKYQIKVTDVEVTPWNGVDGGKATFGGSDNK